MLDGKTRIPPVDVDSDSRHVVARRAESGHSLTKNVFVRHQAHRPVAQARVSG